MDENMDGETSIELTNDDEIADLKVGKLTEEEMAKQLSNTDEIYEANLKNLNKSRMLLQLAEVSRNIKQSMVKDSHEILKVYGLIFKGFTDERIVIHRVNRKDRDDRFDILAINSSGVGHAGIWASTSTLGIKAGDNLEKFGVRLNSIDGSVGLLDAMRKIGNDYDSVADILKAHVTEMKIKRFERFFKKAYSNLEFRDMPENWGENSKVLDNPITYGVVEDGIIKTVSVDYISFDDSSGSTSNRVVCKNKNNASGYGYRDAFDFQDLQRIAPVFVEVHRAMVEYINVLEQRASVICSLKEEIVKEFDKELMYEAAFKDGKKR